MTEDLNNELDPDRLSDQEKQCLLDLAREALIFGVRGKSLPEIESESVPQKIYLPGASFVTLIKNKELRGCIGSLEVTRPLVEDVRLHTVAAALDDFRFPPVREDEIQHISIEVSRLTIPTRIEFDNPEELLSKIRPGIDGVVIKKGLRRATFLPQVWEKVPDVEIFLTMLCRKMGAGSDCWRSKNIEIFTYQVEKFCE
jgi:AmmeMemoRadiSam system protein A